MRDVTKDLLVGQVLGVYRRARVQPDRRNFIYFLFEAVLFRLTFSWAFFGLLMVGKLVAPRMTHVGGL